jgi:hypothetical protein
MRPEEEESSSGASSGGGDDMNLQESAENGHAVDKPRDPERSRDLFGIQLEVWAQGIVTTLAAWEILFYACVQITGTPGTCLE